MSANTTVRSTQQTKGINMTIPHKPELSGLRALYARGDDETKLDGDVGKVYRPVIAWDKRGRALVQCGDQLMPASETEYASHKQFLYLEPSTKVADAAAAEIQRQIADRFYDVNIGEMVYDAIEKAVAKEVAERFGDIDLEEILRDSIEKAVAATVHRNNTDQEN